MSEAQTENSTYDEFEKLIDNTQIDEELNKDNNQVTSTDDVADDDLYSKSPEREEPPPLVEFEDKPTEIEEIVPTPVVQKKDMKSENLSCSAGKNFCC